MFKSAAISAAMSALLWIVITLVTGGTARFAFIGGILCGAVVFAVGYAFRAVFMRNRYHH